MKALMSGAALAALIVVLSAQGAQAQTYSRLVVFGDSLSDNGNLYMATGGANPASPPYWQGRFADGRVFTEMLGFDAANFMGPVSGSINMAFGGARTDSATSPPGMQVQLAQYRARGGTFGPGDLVSVLGGANNVFQGLPAAGASANPTGAIAAVSNAAAVDVNGLVATVAGMGAGTVLVTNLPKLSTTPQFRNTAAAPLADFAVNTFNSALGTRLAATAAANPNTNIIQMDIFGASDVVASNPSAFGISNVTEACFTGTTVCSDPGSYFYFDGVHPTTKGHSVLAALATDYLYYGSFGSRSALLGETAWRHRQDDLDMAVAAFSGREDGDARTRLVFSVLGDQVRTDARGAIDKATTDGYGVKLGLETGHEAWRVGLTGTFRRAEVVSAGFRGDVDSFALDAAGAWRGDAAFVSLAAGAAQDDFNDVLRNTSLGPVVHSSSTRGVSYGARILGGTWFEAGGWGLSPRAGLAYTVSDVDAFFETGSAARYHYQDRKAAALSGDVSLRAEYDAGHFSFHVEGGYRDVLDDGSDALGTGLYGNTAQVLLETVDLPFESQFTADVGLQGRIAGKFDVQIGYRGRFGDVADSHQAVARLSIPL